MKVEELLKINCNKQSAACAAVEQAADISEMFNPLSSEFQMRYISLFKVFWLV